MSVKQVLIWRSDLRNTEGHKVRSGKVAAQLAHASMKAILDQGSFEQIEHSTDTLDVLHIPLTSAMEEWLTGTFTKICLKVSDEHELLLLYQQAKDSKILCSLILDSGLTEFGGVPTHTAIAIGPGNSDKIDEITKHLNLL